MAPPHLHVMLMNDAVAYDPISADNLGRYLVVEENPHLGERGEFIATTSGTVEEAEEHVSYKRLRLDPRVHWPHDPGSDARRGGVAGPPPSNGFLPSTYGSARRQRRSKRTNVALAARENIAMMVHILAQPGLCPTRGTLWPAVNAKPAPAMAVAQAAARVRATRYPIAAPATPARSVISTMAKDQFTGPENTRAKSSAEVIGSLSIAAACAGRQVASRSSVKTTISSGVRGR